MPPGLKEKEILLRDFVRTVLLGINLTSSFLTAHILGIFFSQIRAISNVRGWWHSGALVLWHSGGRAQLWVERGQTLLRDSLCSEILGKKVCFYCRKNERWTFLGYTRQFRINVAVEQLATLHEKCFRRGTKAILFYLNCWLESVSAVSTKLCTF